MTTLVDLLRCRAQQDANPAIYTFLIDGETCEEHLSVIALDQRARAIAAHLQDVCAIGQRALLLYPPGLDYITALFGCLYAGVVAVPVYFPRSRPAISRLRAVAEDAGIALVLTRADVVERVTEFAAHIPALNQSRCIATNAIDGQAAAGWKAPTLTGDSIAFLQYTSGSTMQPRGVILAHHNLLHNLELIRQAFAITQESHGVIWLPPYHDMGLIGGILEPLYSGSSVTMLSPFDFLQRPLRWLQAISRKRATISGGPNFAYELCVEKISPEQCADLDLRSWVVAFNGAEPVHPRTLERFVANFSGCGFQPASFYPCYGLAEATLIVTGADAASEPTIRRFDTTGLAEHRVVAVEPSVADGRDLVSCGALLGNQEIAIVAPETGRELPPDQVGEIWVRGPSVAQGYWRQPALTAGSFHGFLPGRAAGPWLRTGDLGFLQNGELFVTGRLKDMMIIYGQNFYPQDLEWTARESHPAVRSGAGAAFVAEREGQTDLIIVQELDRHSLCGDHEAVAQAIRRAIATVHALQVRAVVLVKPGRLPKTSSGKVQRHLCRERFLEDGLEPIHVSLLPGASTDATQVVAREHFVYRALAALQDAEARRAIVQAYLDEQLLAGDTQGSASNEFVLRDTPQALVIPMLLKLQHSLREDLGVDITLSELQQIPTLSHLAENVLKRVVVN